MSGEWKPGDVAMVQASNRTLPFVATYDGSSWRGWPMSVHEPESIRRVVVIDPEDRDQVMRLAYAAIDNGYDFVPGHEANMAAALRSLIAPPKPEEPTGLGAVVRDADGLDWHRSATGRWLAEDGLSSKAGGWDHVNAVEILSDGVQP